MSPELIKLVAVAIVGSLGLMGPALAIAIIGHTALSGIARNPECSGPMSSSMILAIAFAEAIGIYALIIAIILAMVV